MSIYYLNNPKPSIPTSIFLLNPPIKSQQKKLNGNKILKMHLISIINNQQLMNTIQQFFIQKPLQASKPTTPPFTVTLVSQISRREYQAHMEENTCMVIKMEEKLFIFNPKTKMAPKYDGNGKLQSVTLLVGEHSIDLQAPSQVYLQELYARLRRVLSHKGFNEYFKPLKRLGRGSFAAVYLVEHKYNGQRWAAKVFSREGQKVGFMGEQALQSEILMLKQLDHPNIIRFHGIFETDNLIYLVNQYLSGGTLQDFMRNKATLLGDFITKIISDVLTVLQYLQKLRIMHRDLKPQNIILRQSDQRWVLADFGLAACTDKQLLFDQCGTMGYIAPEILGENTKEGTYDVSCDLYSLGVVAYNLIVGCLPFKVETEGLYDHKVIWNAFQRSEIEGLHPEITRLLQGLLQKSPQKRWRPQQALKSGLFTDPVIIQSWREYNKSKIDAMYQKILRVRTNK